MSKSVLVIDTPRNCEQCRFSGSDGDVCCLEDKLISEQEYFDKKADWCPLLEFPKKKDMEPGKTIIRAAQHEGWNMCIDEILKGANGNE